MSAPYDIDALRAQLASGPAFWRSLDEVARTPAFRSFVAAEFPAAARLAAGPDRRRFFQIMAASFALAGLSGCGDEDSRDHEVPYVRNPLHQEPGIPVMFASATPVDGFANGIVVTTQNNRPIKIEGNPDHPWSRGGTDVFGQASVLGLYDPFRSQSVRHLNRPSSWQALGYAMSEPIATLRAHHGRGLRVLTRPVTSPSLSAQLASLQQAYPEMRWHTHAPVARTALYEGGRAAFGRPVETRLHFDRARVIVSLGGDFLDPGPQQVGCSRDWIDARRALAAQGGLLEMYSAAATPNLTSAKADFHNVAGPAALAGMADHLLEAVNGYAGADPWLSQVGKALQAARGQSIVVAGMAQPAAEHAAVHRLNAALGNAGHTVSYTDPVVAQAAPLAELVQAMAAGEVSALLILDSNPVYTAPADLNFADALNRVKLKIHAGSHLDETAAHADWHLPLAHPLEAWGDARAIDGTVTFTQPTIVPLYGARTAPEILSVFTEPRSGLDLLRDHWSQGQDPAAFDAHWQQAIRDGFLPGTALPDIAVTAAPSAAVPASGRVQGLTVLFRPDPSVWDGSVGNNAWLQELPKPLTKIVWDNVIAVSPGLAGREGLANGDVVTLAAGGRSIEGPVWIVPGQADDAVTAYFGYGRFAPDLLASSIGYDAYPLRAGTAGQVAGATLAKTGGRVKLVSTQDHGSMEGHDFVRVQKVGDSFPPAPELASFYPKQADNGRAWGMVIDLDACIGCNACVTACQSENNIAVVGKEEVGLGREMHWLRIDRYHSGELDAPATHFQPVPCMHCEDAPCEVGCPVEATVHDHEGLNLMVYNRCVGTRACSGYCPYKVRRFNYLDYSGGAQPSVQLQRNPTVSVRAGGVMEKCTSCVQRIADARIAADKGDEHIPDGAVVTACQGACPTRAISFGDLNDQGSAVRAARADGRNYALLEELGVRPRTTYLAKRAPTTMEG